MTYKSVIPSVVEGSWQLVHPRKREDPSTPLCSGRDDMIGILRLG